MAKTVTVTLTTEQVQQMLADARALYPDESNADLEARVEDAAKHQGIYTLAGQWRMARVREEENANRQAEQAAHDALFPPPVEAAP